MRVSRLKSVGIGVGVLRHYFLMVSLRPATVILLSAGLQTEDKFDYKS